MHVEVFTEKASAQRDRIWRSWPVHPLFWILAIFIVVLVFGLGLLVYAFVALFVLLFANWWLVRYAFRHVKIERRCSRDRAEIGQFVDVTLTVTNTGRYPLVWSILEDLLSRHALLPPPPRLETHGRRVYLLGLKPGERTLLSYTLQCCGRGFFQIGPAILETGDLFGLFRRWRVVTRPAFLTVLPELLPIEGFDIASRRPIGEIRMTHRLYQDPTRLAGIRDYRPGDSLRQIHWRATARTGQLQSKLYEPSSIAGATLVLDFHRNSYPDMARAELGITCAASLAAAICAQQQQVGLVTNGRDAAERIRTEGWEADYRSREAAREAVQMRPASQRLAPIVVPTLRNDLQLDRILEVLARLEPGSGLTLAQALVEALPHLPRDATLVVITPRAEDELVATLAGLRQAGLAITVVVNTFEVHDYAVSAGRFLDYGIEARHLRDKASITQLCQPYVLP